MVCTKTWYVHFLSRRTLGLAPFSAAPWNEGALFFSSQVINLFHKQISLIDVEYFSNDDEPRVRKILEQFSRTLFFTGFEFRALFFAASSHGRKRRDFQIP